MKLIPKDTAIRDSYLASLFLCFSLLLFQLAIFNNLSPVIPLFYSRPWGEEQLTSKFLLFIAPLASFAFLALNYLLGRYLSGELLGRILSFSSLVVSLLACITVLRIALITT